MMSRITISLRKHAKSDEDNWVQGMFHRHISSFPAAPRPLPDDGDGNDSRDVRFHFGSYSAQVDTFVIPPSPIYVSHSTGRSRNHSQQGLGERLESGDNSWNGTTPVNDVSTRSSAGRTTPGQSLAIAEWTFGVGRSTTQGSRSTASVIRVVEGDSGYLDESDSEIIELEEIKRSSNGYELGV